ANYTHVAREVLARGVNVIAHLVARRTVNGEMQLSFGSNPDVTVDLLPLIESERTPERDIVMVGETHAQMPFMTGRALVAPGRFDFLIDSAATTTTCSARPTPRSHGGSRHRRLRERPGARRRHAAGRHRRDG